MQVLGCFLYDSMIPNGLMLIFSGAPCVFHRVLGEIGGIQSFGVGAMAIPIKTIGTGPDESRRERSRASKSERALAMRFHRQERLCHSRNQWRPLPRWRLPTALEMPTLEPALEMRHLGAPFGPRRLVPVT